MKKLKPISRIIIALSALLMVSAYFVPLWQIVMWAPQYPEGLSMKIWINNLTGNVRIISALNHYIGMKHIEVSMFPEFSYMIYIIGALIFVGLLAAVINRRIMLVVFSACIVACGLAALVDFYLWGYDYGHNLDPTAPIVVPGMSYQPPLIGTKQLLNFTAFSGPDIGGWIFFVSAALTIAILIFELYSSKIKKSVALSVVLVYAVATTSCSSKPEPLVFGKDSCHTCKMTLMDHKFGSELITRKGKVYKFDDVNCLINFCNESGMQDADIAQVLVVDFSQPEKLISASEAFYLKSPAIKSPMASNIAAFESGESMEKLNSEWQGTSLRWPDVRGLYKK